MDGAPMRWGAGKCSVAGRAALDRVCGQQAHSLSMQATSQLNAAIRRDYSKSLQKN